MLELLDRRIRSTQDLTESIHLPVLGVIGKMKTRRKLLFRRASTPALPAA
jgi:hypothetical protein